MSTELNDTHYAVIVFRKPVCMTDRFLSVFAGQLTHCDILPIDVSDAHNAMTFTSYVGETFSMSINTKRNYNNRKNVAIAIPYNKCEFDLLTTYLYDLCSHNIKYNLIDISLDALPITVRDMICEDVESEDPKDIKKIYCSQAAVLSLRNSLASDRRLLEKLKETNSRVTVPLQLYYILRNFGQIVDCDALHEGKVIPYSLSSPI